MKEEHSPASQLVHLSDGSLRLQPAGQQPRRERAFQRSAGAGMLDLIVHGLPAQGASPELLWLHAESKKALEHYLRQSRQGMAASCVPTDSHAARLLDSLPPLQGSALSATRLQSWFASLEEALLCAAQAERRSAEDYLSSLSEGWRQLGMLCLHLAENAGITTEGGEEKPFAFLATFVHRVGADDKPRHLPLSLANREQLLPLLRPLQSAAQSAASQGYGFLHEIFASQQIFKPCAWSARECYDFLLCLPHLQEAGVETRVVNLWKTQPRRVELEVTLELEDGKPTSTQSHAGGLGMHSLLRFSPQFALGMQHLNDEEVAELLAGEEGLVRFRGEWILLDSPRLQSLMQSWRQAMGMYSAGVPLLTGLRYLLARRSDALPHLPPSDELLSLRTGEQLALALENFRQWEGDLQLRPALSSTLRPYQKEGVRFLLSLTEAGMGACLADDMGLGKSIQVIAWLSHLKQSGVLHYRSTALLIAPASLLGNWAEELARFAPELRLRVLHPSQLSQREQRSLLQNPALLLESYDIAITSYGVVQRNPELAKLEHPALILDEAQAIKNAQSQRTQSVLALSSPRRVALSGTPIENSLEELYPLFHFLNPGLLGESSSYKKMLRDMGSDYSPLKKLIRPFILRRLKSDPKLIPDLPPRSEKPAYCLLTPEQTRLYAREVENMQNLIHEPDPRVRLALILPLLTRFKQICNHPAQYLGEPHYDSARSGKMMRLLQLLEKLTAAGEPALIFTQYRGITEALFELAQSCYGEAGLILHGGTPISQRQQLVRRFQEAGGPPYMILSLKAAGTGLTLTRARHVIHFDRWWNPAVENQASDRAHRLGQKRAVTVHPLITRGTIEENIHRLLLQKQSMADDLLHAGLEQMMSRMSSQELLDLLKTPDTAK